MLPLFVAFVGALCLSVGFTYLVRGWAIRGGIVDVPDGLRRLHDRPIPRLGGVAIFLSFGLALLGSFLLYPHLRPGHDNAGPLVAVLLGGTAIFLLGVWDDLRSLKAEVKLAIEILIALGLFFAGVRIEGLGLLMGEAGSALPFWLSLCTTTLWIVGITNAFNLIDGSDGVAGGAALFASTTTVIILLLFGNVGGAFVALALAGTILGFLVFNFPPASIFLGDCGSLFIGFTLAALGVMTTQTASTTLAVVIPVLSCAVPILDTALAMVRRFLRGDPLFRADRGHIHHRLRDLGHSPRKVALLLYAVSSGFAIASLLLVEPSSRATATTVLLVGSVVVWVSIQRLNIPEFLEFQRIVHRGLQQRSVIANNVRIREAIIGLRAARDSEALLRCLPSAFESGEFERVEIWVRGTLSSQLLESRDFVPGRSGFYWSWSSEKGTKLPQQDLWELQLPLRDDEGRVVGRLSVWRSTRSSHLLTDVRLLAMELHPELHWAMLRVCSRAPEPARVVVESPKPLAGSQVLGPA